MQLISSKLGLIWITYTKKIKMNIKFKKHYIPFLFYFDIVFNIYMYLYICSIIHVNKSNKKIKR